MSLQPHFFFSLRSPYSWLAWRDLRDKHGELVYHMQLTPFWEPDAAYVEALDNEGQRFLYAPMSRDKHLYILSDVKRLSEQRGYKIKWPTEPVFCWEVSHLAYFVAHAQGKGVEYIDAVYHARWIEGRDIHLPETIAAIGTQLGLDGAQLAAAHLDPQIRQAGLAALQSNINSGVFGVPFFTLGRTKFWGIDRLSDFLQLLSNKGLLPPEPLPVASESGIAHQTIFDHAGGCG